MKIKTLRIVFLILCLCCVCRMTFSQKTSISAYYLYALKVPRPHLHYPAGLGTAVSRNIYKKLFVSSGIEFSYRTDEQQNRITPPVNRSVEIYKNSILSFCSGIYYPLLDRRLKINIGSGLVISYFHNSLDYSRFLVSNDLLDMHFKRSDHSFDFGIKGEVKLEYSPGDRVIIFIQSGLTHYPSNYVENLLINSAGLRFRI